MARPLRALLVLAFTAAVVALPARVPLRACATVTGKGSHVAVAAESALIVWDEKAKKQHFIRRASFGTREPYFGFLVPTPTQPELAEAPDEVFTQLSEWTRPEVKTEKVYYTLREWWRKSQMLSKDLGPPGTVTVLDRQRLAGLDAVVLKATDAKALNDWLGKHGYATRPALETWLAPYVKAGWILTAFQIAKADEEANDVSTRAVRMSFTAERPFFPYSEPPDPGEGPFARHGRFLRVFLVATGRMQGAFDAKTAWTGKATWAGPLGDDRREALRGHLGVKVVPIPDGAWLTVFDDNALPRAGTADVFFSPSPDQSELRRPPIIYYRDIIYPSWDVLAVAGLVVLIYLLLCYVQRRRRPGGGKSGKQG